MPNKGLGPSKKLMKDIELPNESGFTDIEFTPRYRLSNKKLPPTKIRDTNGTIIGELNNLGLFTRGERRKVEKEKSNRTLFRLERK